MIKVTLEDLKRWEAALCTQYQIRSDAIIARYSADSPSLEQLGSIRLAHSNIVPIIRRLIAALEALEDIQLHATDMGDYYHIPLCELDQALERAFQKLPTQHPVEKD